MLEDQNIARDPSGLTCNRLQFTANSVFKHRGQVVALLAHSEARAEVCMMCQAPVHCTLYTVHCTLYTVHCILYTVHCTLYTVHCTLYTAGRAKLLCASCPVCIRRPHLTPDNWLQIKYSSGALCIKNTHIVHCTLYTLHIALAYIVHFTLHTLYVVHCTLH